MIYTFLADGFEEVEALAVVDLLRRAGQQVMLVSVQDQELTTGAHGIVVKNETRISELTVEGEDLLFLPGGMPGTRHLKESDALKKLLLSHNREQGRIAAICAAPSILGALGILEGRRAVCYPGFEEELKGAQIVSDPVVTDGTITTSKGMGTAILLGLELTALLCGAEKAQQLAASIQLPAAQKE